MSSTVYVPTHEGAPPGALLPLNRDRGVYGMYAVIATELSLFICLFASYYFLGNSEDRWRVDRPPEITYAVILLVVLLISSLVLHWGDRQVKAKRYGAARVAIWLTVLLGLAFLALQCFEYAHHWKTLTPFSDAYGSVFYAITSFHAAHVIMGVLLLAYVGVLPGYAPSLTPPYRAYRVAAIYWHFVDVVWIFVVTLLYLIPHFEFARP